MGLGFTPITGYVQSDTDEASASPQFFGFLYASNAWYILQVTNSSNVLAYRYVSGSGLSNYQTSWTGRASLSYDYYPNVFKNA